MEKLSLWILLLCASGAIAGTYDCSLEEKISASDWYWSDIADHEGLSQQECMGQATAWCGHRNVCPITTKVHCRVESYEDEIKVAFRNSHFARTIYYRPQNEALPQQSIQACLQEIYRRLSDASFKVMSDNAVKSHSRSPVAGSRKHFHPTRIDVSMWVTHADGTKAALRVNTIQNR